MKFTPLQVALGVSLLVHGGVVSAVYVLRQDAIGGLVRFNHERALEIEIVSEPARETLNQPTPRVVAAAEISKPVAPPPPLPENKPTDLAVTDNLPTAINQPMKSAVPEPVVEAETKTVLQPVPVSSASRTAEKLDGGILANYLFNPKPAYPVEARQRREEGLVILAVQVSREGFPSRIQIGQSSKFERLDRAAVEAVSQWRFTPARLGPQAVASQIEVPIHFKLTSH